MREVTGGGGDDMAEGSDRGGASAPVQVIRGRHSAKVFSLAFLAFIVASNFELYQVSLFSLDTSTRDIDEVLASLAITFVFTFWAVRAFLARVELYDERIVYRGIQTHRVLPIGAIDRLCESKGGRRAFVLLGNEKRYLILGAFEFHKSDIERICDFVRENARVQGRSLVMKTHGIPWLWKKQCLQWPPEYPAIICAAALVWLVFFS